MAPSMVIDCSVTMAWCFSDEQTPRTEILLDRMVAESVAVPSIWLLEVTNVLSMAEKRGRITMADSSEFLSLLGSLQMEIDAESLKRVFENVLPLARSQQLTTYDGAYLELAIRLQLPLATLDRSLKESARRIGVQLLRP